MADPITVEEVLMAHVESLALTPDLPVNYPGVPFTPPRESAGPGATRVGPYVAVQVVPNTAELSGIAYDSEVTEQGLLTFNVVWPAGQGVLKAVRFAQQLARTYAPGTVIVRDGIQVKVYQQPRVAAPVEGNDDLTVPVIVRWVASKTPGV